MQMAKNKWKLKLKHPTCGVDEGRIEFPGQERVGHVPEELLQQRCNVMDAVLFVQLDVDTAVELLTQLSE